MPDIPDRSDPRVLIADRGLDDVDAELVWRGRARMAAARRAAGATLDPYDRQALDRYPEATSP